MDSKRFVTVRDYSGKGSKDGTFYVNVHGYGATTQDNGNFVESNNYPYKQKRTARRIAKNLAKRKGYEYRQDLEYTKYNWPKRTTPLPVEAEVVS